MAEKLTAKMIAEQSKIPYIPVILQKKANNKGAEGVEIYKRKYLHFYPLYDGISEMEISWYLNREKIISNDKFCNIANLSENLLKLINIYIKYIDQDVAIDSFRLGLSLDDEILPDYRGKATICLTEDSVLTKKVGNFERDFLRTKSQCLNDFLDIFLAVNFVKVLQQDEEIAVASQILNNLVTEKGLKLSRHGMFKGKKMFIFS